MPPRKTVALFFARLIAIYAVLAAPWPGLARGYAAAYHAAGNAWFGSVGGSGRMVFSSPATPEATHDTDLTIVNRASRAQGTSTHSARITGYLPTIEAVALILATPLPWPRRWRAVLWGLLVSHGLIWLRLEIIALHWFTGPDPWCLWQPWGWVDRVLHWAFKVGVVSPTPSFVLPVLIWMGVSFRRGDLETLLAPAADCPPGPVDVHFKQEGSKDRS